MLRPLHCSTVQYSTVISMDCVHDRKAPREEEEYLQSLIPRCPEHISKPRYVRTSEMQTSCTDLMHSRVFLVVLHLGKPLYFWRMMHFLPIQRRPFLSVKCVLRTMR